MTQDEPQNTARDNRRKKLIFRSWHRGTREMDLLMGRFAETHVPAMDDVALDAYERLLNCNDPEVYDWYLGRAAPPANDDSAVLRAFLAYRFVKKDQ